MPDYSQLHMEKPRDLAKFVCRGRRREDLRKGRGRCEWAPALSRCSPDQLQSMPVAHEGADGRTDRASGDAGEEAPPLRLLSPGTGVAAVVEMLLVPAGDPQRRAGGSA